MEREQMTVAPPREAYSFWPYPSSCYMGTGKKGNRQIYARQEYTELEQNEVDKLVAMVKQGQLNGIPVPPEWGKDYFLRFCYGTK